MGAQQLPHTGEFPELSSGAEERVQVVSDPAPPVSGLRPAPAQGLILGQLEGQEAGAWKQ